MTLGVEKGRITISTITRYVYLEWKNKVDEVLEPMALMPRRNHFSQHLSGGRRISERNSRCDHAGLPGWAVDAYSVLPARGMRDKRKEIIANTMTVLSMSVTLAVDSTNKVGRNVPI